MHHRFFRHTSLPNWRCHSGIILASFWCAGLLLGIMAAASAEEILFSKMRSAVAQPVSIVPFLAFAPFLLSVIVIHLRQLWLILPCAFIKAFTFGFCAFAVTLAFGQSSWLIRVLFLFSDIAAIPIMYFYWLRCLKGEHAGSFWFSVCCTGALIGLALVDYCWISPFLASII